MSDPDQTSETPAKRLFFALWPDDALRQQLHALGGEVLGKQRGRYIPPENLHLTLAFLGSVDAARQACLEQMATVIRVPAFTLTLDQPGFWPRKETLWVGGTPPAELLVLVQAINQGLRSCGLAPETRPFQVHLTLARNVRGLRLDRDRAITPLAWRVGQFALVASQTLPEGARYEVLKTWRLENGQDLQN